MKRTWILLIALAVLCLGASAVQAQCCGAPAAYTAYYAAPTYVAGGCGLGGCATCAAPCSGGCAVPTYTTYYAPYTTYYAPAYAAYYAPYYGVGYGWRARPYVVGYWGWGAW